MLKHAVHILLLAALVAGGIAFGYRHGLSGARIAKPAAAPSVTVQETLPQRVRPMIALRGFKISDRTVPHDGAAPAFGAAAADAFALLQRPVERSIKLDSAPLVGLFGPPVLSGDPNPTPVRIDYGIPIAGGKFNFTIGYQF